MNLIAAILALALNASAQTPPTISNAAGNYNVTHSTVNIQGPVQVTGPGGGPVPVTGSFSVSGSTSVAASAGGTPITGFVFGSTNALTVLDIGRPNLAGKNFVYISSNALVTSGLFQLNGLGKEISVQAINGSCTYLIDGGAPLVMQPNTNESYDLDFTAINPYVILTAKDPGATCTSRITGVQ